MNFVKKVNRGLILTGLIVIAIIIYLVVMSSVRTGDRSAVKKNLDTYVDAEASQYVTPDKWSEYTSEKLEESKSAVISDIQNSIKEYYADNEECYSSLAEQVFGTYLQTSSDGIYYLKSLEAKIIKISSINFSGDTATVDATLQVNYDSGSKLDGESSGNKNNIQQKLKYVLKKEDGNWKIFYSQGMPLSFGEKSTPYSMRIGG